MPATKFPKRSTLLSIRMILLSNASDVYSQLQRMREIVHESHEYFAEYMRLYIPQEVLLRIETAMRSVQLAMSSIGNSSDYIDTRNRMIFTEDAGHALKSHQATIQAVQNLFDEMLAETCRVILSFMENCVSELLNETIMREIIRHLLKIPHADFFSKCLRIANAIPLFLKNQKEPYYQALHQLCRVDMKCWVILATHTDELCQIAEETQNENVRSNTLEILNLIVSRAAKSLNSVKPSSVPNGIKRPDMHFNNTLYEKLPSIAATATKQLDRAVSMDLISVFHSTLRVISGIWRITTRLGKPSQEIDLILSECVELLIDRLNGYEDRDSKTRHLTMMVIAMLAKSVSSRKKLQKAFVIRRLLEILDDTHQRYVKASGNNGEQSNVSGYIADSETARSTSCESLVKNGALSLLNRKQVTFASDCTLAVTGSKLYDVTSTWRNSKGSLPNLSSSSLSLKQASSNGMLADRALKSLKNQQQTEFIQHILHNCAIALKRICDGDNSDYFHDYGGLDVVNKILSNDKSNQAVIPYLKELQHMKQSDHSTPLENGWGENNHPGADCITESNVRARTFEIHRQTSIPEERPEKGVIRTDPNVNFRHHYMNQNIVEKNSLRSAPITNNHKIKEPDDKESDYLPSIVFESFKKDERNSTKVKESILEYTMVEETEHKQASFEGGRIIQPKSFIYEKDCNEAPFLSRASTPGIDCYFNISKDETNDSSQKNDTVTDYVSSAALEAAKHRQNSNLSTTVSSPNSDCGFKHTENLFLPPENSIQALMKVVDGRCHDRESDNEGDPLIPCGNVAIHQNYELNFGNGLFESISGTKNGPCYVQPPSEPGTTYVIKTTTSS